MEYNQSHASKAVICLRSSCAKLSYVLTADYEQLHQYNLSHSYKYNTSNIQKLGDTLCPCLKWVIAVNEGTLPIAHTTQAWPATYPPT